MVEKRAWTTTIIQHLGNRVEERQWLTGIGTEKRMEEGGEVKVYNLSPPNGLSHETLSKVGVSNHIGTEGRK